MYSHCVVLSTSIRIPRLVNRTTLEMEETAGIAEYLQWLYIQLCISDTGGFSSFVLSSPERHRYT